MSAAEAAHADGAGAPATAGGALTAGATAHPRTQPPIPRGAPPGALAAWLRLLGSELRLILGRRRNQMGMLVLASVPVLVALAVRATASDAEASGGGGPNFIDQVAGNGVFVALTALTVELGLFLPLAVAVLAGDAIAGEANLGTLRYLLTVPAGRTRLLAVKYTALVIAALIGVAVVVVTGIAIGGVLFGLGPVTLLSGSQISLAAGLMRVVVAGLYVTAGLAGLAAIGLFLSTLTEQPIAATIATVVASTTMFILDGITQLDWLHPWLLVHHWAAFADLFRAPVYTDAIVDGLMLAAGYVAVFLGLAWARFAGKDITS